MNVIEVGCRPGVKDVLGLAVKARLEEDLFVKGIQKLEFLDVYRLECRFSPQELERVASELLCDPVTQAYAIDRRPLATGYAWALTVSLHRNVTDNVGIAAREGIEDLLKRKLGEDEHIYYDRKYLFWGAPTGALSEETMAEIATKALANDLMENWKREQGPEGSENHG